MSQTLTPPLSLSDARAQFPLVAEQTYLDVASRAPMSNRVTEALTAYMDVYRTQPLPKAAWLDEVERIRARVARLAGAEPDEIAFTKSTSDSISLLSQGLDLRAGDNVIICPEIEHANNVYPWLHLRDHGVEVRTVAADRHRFPLDLAMDQVDARTRVLSLSSTSFVTGARADLAAITAACHEREVFVLVDGVQEFGAMRMDLPALGVDGLGAATQKMLLSTYGLGVLFCRRDRADRMRPPSLTRMGVDWGDTHESDLSDDYRYRDGAPRFEVGNPNFAGLFALDGALSLIEDVGPEVIEAHTLGLARRLLDGLTHLPVDLLTPPDAHAGLVVFRSPRMEAVETALAAAGITIAVRRGAIRASVHVFNVEQDVDHLLDVLTDTLTD